MPGKMKPDSTRYVVALEIAYDVDQLSCAFTVSSGNGQIMKKRVHALECGSWGAPSALMGVSKVIAIVSPVVVTRKESKIMVRIM